MNKFSEFLATSLSMLAASMTLDTDRPVRPSKRAFSRADQEAIERAEQKRARKDAKRLKDSTAVDTDAERLSDFYSR